MVMIITLDAKPQALNQQTIKNELNYKVTNNIRTLISYHNTSDSKYNQR